MSYIQEDGGEDPVDVGVERDHSVDVGEERDHSLDSLVRKVTLDASTMQENRLTNLHADTDPSTMKMSENGLIPQIDNTPPLIYYNPIELNKKNSELSMMDTDSRNTQNMETSSKFIDARAKLSMEAGNIDQAVQDMDNIDLSRQETANIDLSRQEAGNIEKSRQETGNINLLKQETGNIGQSRQEMGNTDQSRQVLGNIDQTVQKPGNIDPTFNENNKGELVPMIARESALKNAKPGGKNHKVFISESAALAMEPRDFELMKNPEPPTLDIQEHDLKKTIEPVVSILETGAGEIQENDERDGKAEESGSAMNGEDSRNSNKFTSLPILEPNALGSKLPILEPYALGSKLTPESNTGESYDTNSLNQKISNRLKNMEQEINPSFSNLKQKIKESSSLFEKQTINKDIKNGRHLN